jgi:phytanoyl-CoA hydroxylase
MESAMQEKLSPFPPFRFDIGRYLHLLTRPNIGYPRPTGPHDDVFPDSGLIRLPGAVDPSLCDEAVAEYDSFENLRREKGCVINDNNGRNYRVSNLHLRAQVLRDIGLNPVFHDAATRFFGARSSIYTSLHFKHGSQQDPHIDTPFFWTRPFNLFVGVWVALEEVRETAGPLFYYPGSHRQFNSEQALRDAYERGGRNPPGMFKVMHAEIEQRCKREMVLLKKGDAVIWHPGLMHGGAMATVADQTRHSAVFHLAPLGVNVRGDRVFPRDFANLPAYGLVRQGAGFYCRATLPTAMI